MILGYDTQDGLVYEQVYLGNEYKVPAAFESEDVVLDIGAHIGFFATLCLERGAGKVICYEPDARNAALLRENLAVFGKRAEVNETAVWGDNSKLRFKDMFPLTASNFATDKLLVGCEIDSVTMDEVLEDLPVVRLCKIDAEGAEYSIIKKSGLLSRIRELVCEVHEFDETPWKDSDGGCVGLVERLREIGFNANKVENPQGKNINSWIFANKTSRKGNRNGSHE